MITPLVSIVTPVLNGERYIRQCLDSVAAQQFLFLPGQVVGVVSTLEHIVVDGISSDGTMAILADYQQKYSHLKIACEPARGVGAAVNTGFEIAKGSVLGWIDSDDYYEPGAIQTVVDYFTAHPEAMLVYGGCKIVNDLGQPFTEFPVPAAEGSRFIIKPFDEREAIEEWAYIVFCAAFYRREVIEAVGGFNDLGNDLDFWVRVNRKYPGGMHMISQTLTNWRLHRGGISMKRSPREAGIRLDRLKQDYFLAAKYGYNVLAPRPRRYLEALKEG